METITKDRVDLPETEQEQSNINREQLDSIQLEIRRVDPFRSDLPYFVAERLDFIRGKQLFKILGYHSMTEYLLDSQDLFGIRRSTCYNYLKAYKALRKYQSLFVQAGLGMGDNREDLVNAGLYTKLLLLDKAMFVKCRSDYSQEEVFELFLAMTYQEFWYFLYPEKKQEAIWKHKLESWNRQIRNELKRTGKVRIISYAPVAGVRERILDHVLTVSKEVN